MVRILRHTVGRATEDDGGVGARGGLHGAARGGGALRQVRGDALAGMAPRQAQLPHLQHQQRPQRLPQIAACSTPLSSHHWHRQLMKSGLMILIQLLIMPQGRISSLTPRVTQDLEHFGSKFLQHDLNPCR